MTKNVISYTYSQPRENSMEEARHLIHLSELHKEKAPNIAEVMDAAFPHVAYIYLHSMLALLEAAINSSKNALESRSAARK